MSLVTIARDLVIFANQISIMTEEIQMVLEELHKANDKSLQHLKTELEKIKQLIIEASEEWDAKFELTPNHLESLDPIEYQVENFFILYF